MTFYSILFKNHPDGINEKNLTEPDFFIDIHMDQIIEAITHDFEEYHLKPIFSYPLSTVDDIFYRHQIMQDLENPHIHEAICSFSASMKEVREYLALVDKLYYQDQKKRWFLEAIDLYCLSVYRLMHDLTTLTLQSTGLSLFQNFLIQYTQSHEFTAIVEEIRGIKADLGNVRYCLHIHKGTVTVRKYNEEVDYHITVDETCKRFSQDSGQYVQTEFPTYPEMNHVEANILKLVTQLYPEVFPRLSTFYERDFTYLDPIITRFDREIQFYIAYLKFMNSVKPSGLRFCIPEISDTCKEVFSHESYDLSLATKLAGTPTPIVCNDFYLKDSERIFVITGPNQGGKTTFARTFGQLHYLGSLGCFVPGRSARLFLYDRIFTHFEREEDINNLMSKLEDDLIRIHAIISASTSRSIIIINEMFTSTTIQDACFLGKKVIEHAQNLDLLCIYVTFLDELTLLDKTVSLVSGVVAENPDLRTYKIERNPANGLSYAHALVKKNRLTSEEILERISS